MTNDFRRNKFGLLHEGLFSRAMSGTKLLVEEYHASICRGLDFCADGQVMEGEESIPTDARLAFFNETRHSYGRTALLLSGGAALGFYHAGVVKVLIENGLMPRVIGGASAGSIVLAMIGTRTDEECLRDLFQVKGTKAMGHSGYLQLDFFRPQGYANTAMPRVPTHYSKSTAATHDTMIEGFEEQIGTGITPNKGGWVRDLKKAFQFLTPRGIQWFTNTIWDVLRCNRKAGDVLMNDTNHFRRCVRASVGNFTFQEAFDRTGRILNITVSPQNRSDPPRLLNYLTAPHVLCWSAAVASSSLPGVFEASKLMVKDSDGTERFESTSGARFQDGSMENDLPMQQLSEMFNVNHFVISQVNPHAYMLSSLSLKTNVWTGKFLGLANGLLQFLKNEIKYWVKNLVELIGGRRLAPLWEMRRGFFTQLLTQEYEGKESDVTINPWRGHRSLASAFAHCIYNPSDADFMEWMRAAEMETWRHIPEIKSHCATEMTLDRCVQRLRKRLLMESHVRHRQMTNADLSLTTAATVTTATTAAGSTSLQPLGLGNKLPSFYTSPSLVNLSGLAVGDQPVTLDSAYPTTTTGGSNNSIFKGEGWDSAGADYEVYEDAPMTIDSDDADSVGEGRSSGGSVGKLMSRDSSNSTGSISDGLYVKSTAMANFYYRKNKSHENLKNYTLGDGDGDGDGDVDVDVDGDGKEGGDGKDELKNT